MDKITAIIERGDDGGFCIYCEEIKGLIGSGLSEEDARQDFIEVKEEQAAYYAELHGEMPKWYQKEVEFCYSLGAFFVAFPFINATQLAKSIGINPSLMRKYKQGLATASGKQKQLIQENLNRLTDKLRQVQLA